MLTNHSPEKIGRLLRAVLLHCCPAPSPQPHIHIYIIRCRPWRDRNTAMHQSLRIFLRHQIALTQWVFSKYVIFEVQRGLDQIAALDVEPPRSISNWWWERLQADMTQHRLHSHKNSDKLSRYFPHHIKDTAELTAQPTWWMIILLLTALK